jgi:hypothetical protein
MRKSVAAVLLSLLITTPLVFAQYQRVVYSGKGETRDIAISHPLSYWTSDPTARDDGGDLCLDCKTSDGKIVTKQDYPVRVDVNRLGSLGGHEISKSSIASTVTSLSSARIGSTASCSWT